MARLLALMATILLAACSAAGSDKAAAPNGRVRDLAGVLDSDAEARLAQRLDEAQRLYGPQVGIVTVSSLDGKPIEDFARDYANKWGFGDKDRDDGILILVAPNDHEVRIATGAGIGRNYPNDWCQEVIDRTMLPQFRQANYARGLSGALDMIVARMKQYPTLPANDNASAAAGEAA